MSHAPPPPSFPYIELEEARRLYQEQEEASNRLFDAVFPSLPTPHPSTLEERKRAWRSAFWRRYKVNLGLASFLAAVYLGLIIRDIWTSDWWSLAFNLPLSLLFVSMQVVVIPMMHGAWQDCPYLPGYKKRHSFPQE